MKTIQLSKKLLFALLLSASGLTAQSSNNQILISGPKFAQPLIEKWISEYSKTNPGTSIKLAQKDSKANPAQLNLILEPSSTIIQDNNQTFISAGRYALLPVSNNRNPILKEIKKKGLNKKELDKLFFEPFDEDIDPEEKETKLTATVYSAENINKQSVALAEHFGHLSSELRGKKVLGDEIYLLTALKKDSTGVSYNNLNYLFDINSRKIKSDIAILPLSLKKEEKNLLTGNIDDALTVLEINQIESVPVGKIGFTYLPQNSRNEITDFLNWILTEGQKFNHELGFLNLENQDILTAQKNLQNEKLLTLN